MSSGAIIDDNDPIVQYSDGWTFDETYPYALGLTRHGATTRSDLMATVKFRGADHSNYTTPGAGFVLDGATSGVFNGYKLSSLVDTIYNQTLFSKDGLPLQDHELTIANVHGNNPVILWLDYFLVGGQPSTSSLGVAGTWDFYALFFHSNLSCAFNLDTFLNCGINPLNLRINQPDANNVDIFGHVFWFHLNSSRGLDAKLADVGSYIYCPGASQSASIRVKSNAHACNRRGEHRSITVGHTLGRTRLTVSVSSEKTKR
ncbi:hypothetical protein C8T65DRAFT_828095 [Cerioporus squamosus]|nr:hypothetical protein C8T65DRAFT_828095 [Cerioporus squamosus]